MNPKKTLRDIDVSGKRALVRVDFNVPLTADGGDVSDDARIRAALLTIQFLREHDAKVVLCSHLGRPRGRVVEELRLRPVRQRLAGLLDVDVIDAGGPGGESPRGVAEGLQAGAVALLENLRFDPREEKNDPGLARELAALGEVFVNDAFGAAHRAHASTAAVAELLPAVAGFLMSRELEMLGAALETPRRPLIAIIGGAKVTDKIAVLKNLIGKADQVLVGGGMVAAFARARGYRVGGEPADEDTEAARQVLEDAGEKLLLPTDAMTGTEFSESTTPSVFPLKEVPAGFYILDIGPETRAAFANAIARAKTVIWNGPMGVFEWRSFSEGTSAVAEAVAGNREAVTIIGGGSTAEAVGRLGLSERMTHVSTGGGASLEFLEGKVLPGVAALMDRD